MKQIKKHTKLAKILLPLACVLATAISVQAIAIQINNITPEQINEIKTNRIELNENGKTKLLVLSNKVDIDVIVDGNISGTLSGTYSFGDTAQITAPTTVSDKDFSYWEADGNILSCQQTITLTATANTTLKAVYGQPVSQGVKVGFVAVSEDNSTEIVFDAFTSASSASEVGIYYSTTAKTKDDIISSGTKMIGTQDENSCWTLKIEPDNAKTFYYAVPFAKVDSDYYYGTVKKVNLAGSDHGSSAQLNDNGIKKIDLKKIAKPETAQYLTEPSGKNIIYNGDEQGLINAGNATGGTVQYSLSETGGFRTDIPTAKETGVYTVWYKIVGDISHLSTEPKSVTTFINSLIIHDDDVFVNSTTTTPEVFVADCRTGAVLTEGTDYILEIADDTVTITGKGSYTGRVQKDYIVLDRKTVSSVANRRKAGNNAKATLSGEWYLPKNATNIKAGIARISTDDTNVTNYDVYKKGVKKSCTLKTTSGKYSFSLLMNSTHANQNLYAVTYVTYEIDGKKLTSISKVFASYSNPVA